MITENADKWVLQQHVAMYERLLLEELTKANSTKSRRNELTELQSDARRMARIDDRPRPGRFAMINS